MITSTGKPITHTDIILQLLDAVLLPLKVAVCKCTVHTTGTDPVSVGNRRADEEAKRAAQLPPHRCALATGHQSVRSCYS